MKNPKALPVHRTVIQFDRGSLIVILHNFVVFQFEDGGQLNAMAFKLNCDPHLPAGIAAGYVRASAAHAARRIGASNLCNGDWASSERLTRLAQAAKSCSLSIP